MRVDHENEKDVEDLFKRIADEQEGQLDLLVNNAYKGVEVGRQRREKKHYHLRLFLF